MSRQTAYQQRMIERGRCRICGQKRQKDDPQMCPRHRQMSRDSKARRRANGHDA